MPVVQKHITAIKLIAFFDFISSLLVIMQLFLSCDQALILYTGVLVEICMDYLKTIVILLVIEIHFRREYAFRKLCK